MPGSSAARLLARQTSSATGPDGCALCSDAEPSCNCAWNQHCIVISRDCDTCSSTQCIDDDQSLTGAESTSGKGSVSTGTVAAAIIVPILALIAVASVFFWLRRRRLRLQQHSIASAAQTPKAGSDLLNRANNLTFQAPICAVQYVEKPSTPPPVHQSFPIAVYDEPRRSAQETVYRARAAASAPSLRSTSSTAPLPIKPPSHKTTASISQNSSASSVVLHPLPLPSRRVPPKATGSTSTSTKTAPSAYTTTSDSSSMRKRASLDTLALTSDLSKYPLGFDSANVPALPPTPVSQR
ncbi:hypothetical protein ONZ51_g13294 [Trametes cubensis]|uniref:Membrane anchor Opy2 N-terminal domain-containing protein n=1 Tax=Trametes cubensis TaxID=1111947 RepID=A0AAD7TEM3_9APHY|nr:hypothetical protein ONZ51_g13294 [Trametes cubensis]